MQAIANDLISIAWIAAALIGLGLLCAGGAKKVVIFYDGSDFFTTILAVVLPFLAIQMYLSSPFQSTLFNSILHWIAAPLVALLGIIAFISTFKDATRHNKSPALGLFVGIFKLLFTLLSVLVFIGQMGKLTDGDSTKREKLGAAIWLALFALLAKCMINGKDVYEARGWDVPTET